MSFLLRHLLTLILAGNAYAVTNPSGFVLPAGFADPRSLFYNGSYYAFATNNQLNDTKEPVGNVPAASSPHFSTDWTYSEADVLPDPGPWVNQSDPMVWDTAVHAYNNSHFVMYYAAKKTNGTHCVGAAASTSILGTYAPQETPLLCGGTIVQTPNPFIYEGVPYFVYKQGDYNYSSIHLQKLTADGTGIIGSSVELVHESGSEIDTEGPAMAFNPNNAGHPILLFTSGFFTNTSYQIMYATAPTSSLIPPQGQLYTKNETPLLHTGSINGVEIYGPGGPSFPSLPNSPYQLTFMSDPSGTTNKGRSMRTANITYSKDNTLSIK